MRRVKRKGLAAILLSAMLVMSSITGPVFAAEAGEADAVSESVTEEGIEQIAEDAMDDTAEDGMDDVAEDGMADEQGDLEAGTEVNTEVFVEESADGEMPGEESSVEAGLDTIEEVDEEAASEMADGPDQDLTGEENSEEYVEESADGEIPGEESSIETGEDTIVESDEEQAAEAAEVSGEESSEVADELSSEEQILEEQGEDFGDETTETLEMIENPDSEAVSSDAMMDGETGDPDIVASGKCGANLTWTLNSDYVLTISGTGEMSGTPWSSDYQSQITKIVIEDGVTSISTYAFFGYASVTSVTIPGSLTTIGDSAFNECSSLTELYFPDLSTWLNLGSGFLNLYSSHKDLYINNELLTELIIPEGTTSIGKYAFSGCSSITDVTFPDSVTSIGNSAFSGCSSITDVTFPDYLITIGDYAFFNCSSLTDVTIPDGVTSIGEDAFSGCSSLEDILFPENLTSIGIRAFRNCTSLTSITLPDGEASIGDRAFMGCSSLSSVTFPSAHLSMGEDVFSGCRLKEKHVPDLETWLNLDAGYVGGDLYVNGETLTDVVIPNSITEIRDSAFSDCSSLVSVTVPEGVTSIGSDAFSSCSNLTSVTLPARMDSIGANAFNRCHSLTGIVIPEGVTSIEYGTFYECMRLKSVSLPTSLTSIEEAAFYNCYNLKDLEINISDVLTWMNSRTYNPPAKTYSMYLDKELLTDLIIPDGVTDIPEDAFSGCKSITSVTIPEGVTSIGSSAFSCENLNNVTVPASVTNIGENAFESNNPKEVHYGGSKDGWDAAGYGIDNNMTLYYAAGDIAIENKTYNCNWMISRDGNLTISGSDALENNSQWPSSDIRSVVINEGITGISYSTFTDFTNLTSVTIPESVRFIGSSAFSGCSSLKSVTIPEGVTNINDNVFSGCSSLESVTIPESVKYIGYAAFNNCNSLADVYYLSDRGKWNQIEIEEPNEPLFDAVLHTYNDIAVSDISLDKTSVKLQTYRTLQLTAAVFPENATYKTITWTSSDDSVATVNSEGIVEGTGEGTATITATAADGSGAKATCTVTVFENNHLSANIEGTEAPFADVDVQVGKSTELRVTVSAIDESELSFQWYKYYSNPHEVIAIEGATDTSYTVTSENTGEYYFEAKDQYGNSSGVYFDVHLDNCLHAYVEGTDSSETELCLTPGESSERELRVTVSAIDESELSFQWYDIDGEAIQGARGTSYTIASLNLVKPVTYEFRVSDQYGSVAYARFHITLENHLQAYAEGTTDTEAYLYSSPGESAKLQVDVSADDESKLSFQWFKLIPDYSGKLEYQKISGATGRSYTVQSVNGFARYACKVKDQYDNQTEVRLYTCIADFDNVQTIACGDAVSVSVSSEADAEAYPVYRFIPDKTAGYKMYSANGVDDPYLEILNSSRKSVIRTASPFEDPAVEYDGKGHFQLEQVLEAGETYYLIVGSYSHSSSCELHLEMGDVAVTGINLNRTSASIEINKTLQLKATVLPDDATNKTVTWTSSNAKAATVDRNGKVTGKGEGTATITATAADGSGATAACTVKVTKPSVANATVSGLVAKTYTGKALTQTPKVVIGSKTLILNTDYKLSYSNNTNAGTATLIITGAGTYSGKKTVTFTINKAAQTITAKSTAASLAVGKTATVSITGNKGAKSYKSSNTAVATVTSAGKVTAKKVGTVTITAAAAATGNYKPASKTVTIKIVPAATASVNAENQAAGIRLTWNKVTGATGYKVYRGSTLLKTITSGSTVTFTDTKANTNGTKYTFKVYATASTGTGPAKSLITYCVARPAISSATNSAAGKMTVKWGKNAKGTGYLIQYSLDKTFKTGNKSVTIQSASTVSKVIGSLTRGKTYYARIRTFKTVGSTKYYSAWSLVKVLKINK